MADKNKESKDENNVCFLQTEAHFKKQSSVHLICNSPRERKKPFVPKRHAELPLTASVVFYDIWDEVNLLNGI